MLKNGIPVILGALLLAAPAFAGNPDPNAKKPDPTTGVKKPGSTTGTEQTQGTGTMGSGTTGTQHDHGSMMHDKPTTASTQHQHDDEMAMLDTDMSDLQLAAKIHKINLHEIEMATMAMERATSAQVKAYAKQIESDHKRADKSLTALATKKGWGLESEETAEKMAAKKQEKMEHMKSLTGAEFDRHFLVMMHKGHSKAILTLTTQAFAHPIDKDLKAAIKKEMPNLEKHRTKAIQLLEREGPKDMQAAAG
jgi:putative membrane protein